MLKLANVVSAVSLAGALFIAAAPVAHAQVFYRGMNNGAVAGQPQVANTALGLGVRPQDVGNPAAGALVPPNAPAPPPGGTPQGMSVAINNACDLPAFTRPAAGNWHGTGGGNVRVFQMNAANLPGTLQLQPAPLPGAANHAVISNVGAGQTLAAMQGAIGGTVANWAVVPPPPAMCP